MCLLRKFALSNSGSGPGFIARSAASPQDVHKQCLKVDVEQSAVGWGALDFSLQLQTAQRLKLNVQVSS